MNKAFRHVKNYLLISLGCVITAAAINIFLVPFKIAPGGVAGIATVIYYLSSEKMPVGTTMLILNIPLFILGFRLIGKRFFIRTLAATVLLSAAIDGLEPLTDYFADLVKLESANMDLLLYSLFGGFLMGVGLGFVFRSGATTGGTDLAAKIVNHFTPAFTMGQVLLIIDSLVIVFAAAAFKSFQLAMYAMVTLFIASRVIDTMLEGVNFAKALFIISDRSDEIAQKILSSLDRGVTSLEGTGMYTGKNRQVLFCVVQRSQLPVLKKLVKEIDSDAFLILTDVREVLGEGFKTYES